MGDFAFKVFLHVSFVVVVVVVVGFAYIGCGGCGTSRGRTAVRGCRTKRANSLTIDQRQMIQARRTSSHSTINSFNLMAPAVGPMSMVPVHLFIAL